MESVIRLTADSGQMAKSLLVEKEMEMVVILCISVLLNCVDGYDIRTFLVVTEIVDQRKRNQQDEYTDFGKIDDPEVRSALANMDMDFEPDPSQFSGQYVEYEREKYRKRLKYRREKLARKHFREFEIREINILTWAEKETIRYLHRTNPGHWSPENLSAAFPISPEGVLKLLKSGFRITKQEDIIKHDQQVKYIIEGIQSGRVPMTPELEAKMEMREKIPIQVGALPPNAKDLAIPAKPPRLGVFARIVASPERIQEVEEANRMTGKPENKKGAHERFAKDMKRFNISTDERLTLGDLEKKLRTGVSKSSSDTQVRVNPEIEYLLRLKERTAAAPVSASEVLQGSPSTPQDFMIKRVPKFKPSESNSNNPLTLDSESGQQYMYDPATGYQKPFASDIKDKIEIPGGKKIPGATYQVGDSFYDENGDFLYKVI